jgi:hypothetical protein
MESPGQPRIFSPGQVGQVGQLAAMADPPHAGIGRIGHDAEQRLGAPQVQSESGAACAPSQLGAGDNAPALDRVMHRQSFPRRPAR